MVRTFGLQGKTFTSESELMIPVISCCERIEWGNCAFDTVWSSPSALLTGEPGRGVALSKSSPSFATCPPFPEPFSELLHRLNEGFHRRCIWRWFSCCCNCCWAICCWTANLPPARLPWCGPWVPWPIAEWRLLVRMGRLRRLSAGLAGGLLARIRRITTWVSSCNSGSLAKRRSLFFRSKRLESGPSVNYQSMHEIKILHRTRIVFHKRRRVFFMGKWGASPLQKRCTIPNNTMARQLPLFIGPPDYPWLKKFNLAYLALQWTVHAILRHDQLAKKNGVLLS